MGDTLLKKLLVHLDQILGNVADTPSFDSLSAPSMLALLASDFQNDTADFVFEVFLSWIKNKKIDAVIKIKMLDSFDLHKFSSLFLLKTVQKTGFYKDEDIFSILIKNVTMHEEQKRQIEILETQVREVKK